MPQVASGTEITKNYAGFILDLDGVVTRSASLHFEAWRETFDEFLAARHPDQRPFSQTDYREHVDGMPRLDGVRAFLASRGIQVGEGGPEDGLEAGTVTGIGNTKNTRFREMVRHRGADVFRDAVEAVSAFRDAGKRVAIASSSRNARLILESVALLDRFDAVIDGESLNERGLPGKPAPDMYLAAAERLGVPPAGCVVFEDALAGVEAGRRGGFGLVVGVDRDGEAGEGLREHGADVVIRTFDELLSDAASIPPLFERLEEFDRRIAGRMPAVFLDYDGTLTPIVKNPEDALMPEETREAVRALSQVCFVAIVSGRDRRDVENLVGLDEVVYAGSHGFDIRGPSGRRLEHDKGEAHLASLDEAEALLRPRLEGIPGARIERKRYSIAVHYRNVEEADAPRVERAVDETIAGREGLRKGSGKKVLEIQPDIEWDKGHAVLWLIDALGLDERGSCPIYVGDDTTDEDAFRALRGRGLGVLVDETGRASAADFRIDDPDATRRLLRWLMDRGGGGS